VCTRAAASSAEQHTTSVSGSADYALREAAGGSTEPAAEEATDVEAVSAAVVLAGVEESGPNYALPTAREGQRERRERLRVDARRSDKIC